MSHIDNEEVWLELHHCLSVVDEVRYHIFPKLYDDSDTHSLDYAPVAPSSVRFR
jgi:hypothetical protein